MEQPKYYDPRSNPGRKNIYVCETCHRHVVTRDMEDGVTPFMINCQCTHGCRGKMYSSFYRVFDPKDMMAHEFEWYRPNVLQVLSPAEAQHVSQGGLLMRRHHASKPTWSPTHIHVKSGGKYRIIGSPVLRVSDQSTHIFRDGDQLVSYQGQDGNEHARYEPEFNDGRFEKYQ